MMKRLFSNKDGVSVIVGALMLIVIVVALSAGFFAFAAQQQDNYEELQGYLQKKEMESLDIFDIDVQYNEDKTEIVNVSVWVSANWSDAQTLGRTQIKEMSLNRFLRKLPGIDTSYSEPFASFELVNISKMQQAVYYFNVSDFDSSYATIFKETTGIGDALTVSIQTSYGNIFEETFTPPSAIIETDEDSLTDAIVFDASNSHGKDSAYIVSFEWNALMRNEQINDNYLLNVSKDYTCTPNHINPKVLKVNETGPGNDTKYIIFADVNGDGNFSLSDDIILKTNNGANTSFDYNSTQYNTSFSNSLHYVGDEIRGFLYDEDEIKDFSSERFQLSDYDAANLLWILLEIEDNYGMIKQTTEKFLERADLLKSSLEEVSVVSIKPIYDQQNETIVDFEEIKIKNNAGFESKIDMVEIDGIQWIPSTENKTINGFKTKTYSNSSWLSTHNISAQDPFTIGVYTNLSNIFQKTFFPPSALFSHEIENNKSGTLDGSSSDSNGDGYIVKWTWKIQTNRSTDEGLEKYDADDIRQNYYGLNKTQATGSISDPVYPLQKANYNPDGSWIIYANISKNNSFNLSGGDIPIYFSSNFSISNNLSVVADFTTDKSYFESFFYYYGINASGPFIFQDNQSGTPENIGNFSSDDNESSSFDFLDVTPSINDKFSPLRRTVHKDYGEIIYADMDTSDGIFNNQSDSIVFINDGFNLTNLTDNVSSMFSEDVEYNKDNVLYYGNNSNGYGYVFNDTKTIVHTLDNHQRRVQWFFQEPRDILSIMLIVEDNFGLRAKTTYYAS